MKRDAEFFIGRTLPGGYRLTNPLGAGEFGTTFEAYTPTSTMPVAVKVFHHNADPKAVATFAQEAITLAQLKHPNIVPFYRFGVEQVLLSEARGREVTEYYPFFVMQYANSGDVRKLKPRESHIPVPPDRVVDIISQAASGVQFAHDAETPYVHRDLKPENLLLHRRHPQTDHLDILVSDFGIAIGAHTIHSLHLDQQYTAGTPPYMAPEQFRRQAVRESDQYALGVIAYELLTGRRPFEGEQINRDAHIAVKLHQWEEAHNNEIPLSFSEKLRKSGQLHLMNKVLEALEPVVLQALAKEPTRRFGSVHQFAETLEETHIKAMEEENKWKRVFEAVALEKQVEPVLESYFTRVGTTFSGREGEVVFIVPNALWPYEKPATPLVAKFYHDPNGPRSADSPLRYRETYEKIPFMSTHPPYDPMRYYGHVSIATVLHPIVDQNGYLIGTIMDGVEGMPPGRIDTVGARLKAIGDGKVSQYFNYRYSLLAVRNMASVVETQHSRGVIIGDLNDTSFLIKDTGFVTLIDYDSVQVPRSPMGPWGPIYHSNVARRGFYGPERITRKEQQRVQVNYIPAYDWSTTIRYPYDDSFALGIISGQMLLNRGFFESGVISGQVLYVNRDRSTKTEYLQFEEGGSVLERIKRGITPDFSIPEGIRLLGYNERESPITIVLPSIQRLWEATFVDGAINPLNRPTAHDYVVVLAEADNHLIQCKNQPNHMYFDNNYKANEPNHGCFSCDYKDAYGRDIYPDKIT